MHLYNMQTISCHVVVLLLACGLFYSSVNLVAATEDASSVPTPATTKDNPDQSHVSHIRYRSRPVATFRSTKSTSGNSSSTTNSTETDGSEPSGVHLVHELTSQTFEKLHENWKNLETFIRNLQARRSQEESLRSSSSSQNTGIPGDRDGVRRPPYNSNVYTFKYHPVVLEGEGTTGLDDGLTGKSHPSRNLNGNYHFNPFPFNPRGQDAKDGDNMERHTVATIYTIGICLAIMAIGSVMFILINKCDGSNGNNYTRSSAPNSSGSGNRITRSVLGAATRAARPNTNNGRSRSSRRGRSGNDGNVQNLSAANIPASGVCDNDAKTLTDLPPSYASLFPEVTPKSPDLQEPTCSADDNTHSSSSNSATHSQTSCPVRAES